jgi:hypothetical protein
VLTSTSKYQLEAKTMAKRALEVFKDLGRRTLLVQGIRAD